jgi:hypothetical protein
VELSLTDALAARVELLLASRGMGNTEIMGWHGPAIKYLRTTYIEIPLLLGLETPLPRAPVRARIIGGFAPAIEIACRQSAPPPPGAGSVSEPPALPCHDYERITDWFDFGAVVGGAVAVELRSVTLSLEGRYTYGLSDISTSAIEGADSAAITNRVLAVFFGVAARM